MNEDTTSGADLGTVNGLPLHPALGALLSSLEPVRVTRHHRRPGHRPLQQVGRWPNPTLLSQRLGFTVPTLSLLRERGQLEVVGPDPAEVRAPHDLAAGETAGVSVIYVPHEQTLELSLEQALAVGATCLGVRYGHGHPRLPPLAAMGTRRDPASGDSTVVDVRGQLMGVQHLFRQRTRLWWSVGEGAGGYDVEVVTGSGPLEAVRLLAGCDLFMGADAA